MDGQLAKFREYVEERSSTGTARVYAYAIAEWFNFLDGNTPSASNAQDYIKLLSKQGKSASTVAMRGHAIIRWFKWRKKTVSLELPTIRMGEPKYMSLQDIEKLLANCKTPLERVLVTVLFDTAVRIAELLNLNKDDIDWALRLITVTRKGGRRQEVNISDKALDAVADWLDRRSMNSKRVFMDITYLDAWRTIKVIGVRAGMKVNPHLFRHSRAIHMLRSGRSLHDVQQHLGHKSITTTANIYGQFTALDLKERIPAW